MKPVEVISFSLDPWYIVHCKSNKEIYAANMLKNQPGLTVYVPEIEICIHKEIQRVPFFSGYFFIQANLQRVGSSYINSSPGVLRLLDFGDGPLEVPPTLIEAIQEEVRRRKDGLLHKRLSSGDSVRVTSGPLEGLQAIFLKSITSGERARVLLHLLGRLSQVQLDMNVLEKSDPEENFYLVSTRRERLTRGKGRRIHKN